jgi:hypothetical protein
VKDRPILFSAPMACAVGIDQKTQTRRVVKPTMSTPRVAPLRMEPWIIDGVQEVDDHGLPCWAGFHPDYPGEAKWFSCPHGGVGDRLWVRETWRQGENGIEYRADAHNDGPVDGRTDAESFHWKPSIFMPRWASRFLLEITEVKIEQVQDITEEDAIAEWCHATQAGNGYPFAMSARMNFVDLWDDINAKRGYGWAVNPWVWAITFKRIV